MSISKSGDPFAFPQYIGSSLDKMSGELERERRLAGTGLEGFAVRGAYCLGEINAIHPFREGNGRAQREFIREIGVHNGLTMDWRRISQDDMIEASRRSLRIDNARLEQVLRKSLDNEPNGQRVSERGRGGIERGR